MNRLKVSPWLVFFIIITSVALFTEVFIILYPFPLDYGEGVILNFSNILIQGKSYFVDLKTPPFIQGAYPPAMPVLISLIRLIVPSIPALMVGRLTSFLFGMGICFFVYKIIVYETQRKKLAPYFSLVLFSSNIFIVWTGLLRVDTMAVFFSMWGIYVYRRFGNDAKRFWSIPLFILAFYSKQNALIAPAAILIYLALKNRKEFIRFSSIYILSLFGSFLFLNVFTHGQFFLHLIQYMGIGLNPLAYIFSPLLFACFFVIVCGFVYLIWTRKKKISNFYFIYAVLAFVSIISMIKSGAGSNYLIEPITVFAILAGICSGEDGIKDQNIFFALSFQAMLGILIVPSLLTVFIDSGVSKIADLYVNRYKDTPIHSEDPGFLSIKNLEVFYEPFQLNLMNKYGLFDNTKIISLCEKRFFGLIIAGYRIKENTNLYSCILKNYKVSSLVYETTFFLPKN